MDKRAILRSIAFGHRVAEDETDVLSTYFVETDHWQRLYRGDIDIIYGPKGSGKSALYSLLLSKSTEWCEGHCTTSQFGMRMLWVKMLPNKMSRHKRSSSTDCAQIKWTVGPNKPNTVDWLLTRTRDGTKSNAPRELIHFLNCLREVQVKRLEIGEPEPEGEILFARPCFKEALPEVSKVRLEQTLYAEYPARKEWIEKLRGAKTLQTPETLATIWAFSRRTQLPEGDLATIGFFDARFRVRRSRQHGQCVSLAHRPPI